jgi:hypothetical protein
VLASENDVGGATGEDGEAGKNEVSGGTNVAVVRGRNDAAGATGESGPTRSSGVNDASKKRKGKEIKGKVARKKRNTYEKCEAFLCQEPPVDESTGRPNWVQCDKCDSWYHWDCVGLLRKPTGNFFCGCDKILFSDRYKKIEYRNIEENPYTGKLRHREWQLKKERKSV